MRVPHVRLRSMLLEGLITVVAWGACLGFGAWRVAGRTLKWLKVKQDYRKEARGFYRE